MPCKSARWEEHHEIDKKQIIQAMKINHLFGAAVLIALCLKAHPQSVMIGNLGSSAGPSYLVSSSPNIAAAFDTGGSPTALYSVTADVSAIFGLDDQRDSSATYTATLFSDASGAPGSPLTTIGTAFSPNAGYGLVDLVASGTPYVLAANTQYWVVMNYNGQPTDWAGWEATAGNSVTGAAGWNIPAGNDILGSAPDYTFTPLFALEATPVPEPSTLAMAGLGIGSLLVIRRHNGLWNWLSKNGPWP
jgi:hypothetical protein